MQRRTQNVPKQKKHRSSIETDYTEHTKDDDQSMGNRLPNTFDGGAVGDTTHSTGDDYVDNVSTSDRYDSTSCLRKRITKSTRKSSPQMHCNNIQRSTTSTCDLMQPTATLRQTSAGYDRDMSPLHRPHFASGAKLKKIVFNGTFPIDDPYSSRFDYDDHLLE